MYSSMALLSFLYSWGITPLEDQMKARGYRHEEAWYEFIRKQTEKFGCPLTVRAANVTEDREQGWDLKISNPRIQDSVLVDITLDVDRKRVKTWIKPGLLGYKDKVDMQGVVRQILVVNAKLLTASAFFTWIEKKLATR